MIPVIWGDGLLVPSTDRTVGSDRAEASGSQVPSRIRSAIIADHVRLRKHNDRMRGGIATSAGSASVKSR
jgi:hypothetical protein